MDKMWTVQEIDGQIAELKKDLATLEEAAAIIRRKEKACDCAKVAAPGPRKHPGYVKIATRLMQRNGGSPMHMNEIVTGVQKKLRRKVSPDSVISTLYQTTKAKHPKLEKVGPAMFGIPSNAHAHAVA